MKHIAAVLFSFILIFCCIAHTATAQFQTVYIGVNGLTCSQCSRTVEMSLRKLDFVADVDMNLQHTEGKITLKKNTPADMDKIAQAVVNAGFSLRYLNADLAINPSVVDAGKCFLYNDDQYIFTEKPKPPFTGTFKLKFIGKKYLSKTEFKKMAKYMDAQCVTPTGKVYHVTALNS